MNQINFLPQSYLQQQARRRSSWRQSLLIVVIAAVMVMWTVSTQRRLMALERYEGTLRGQSLIAKKQVTRVNDLREQHNRLSHQLRIQRELAPSINPTAVVATLAQLMPQSVTLSSLTLEGPTPTASRPAVKTAANESTQAAAPRPAEVLKVELVGLAPSDVEVANLVGRLAESPLFVNVKMLFSRATEVNQTPAREFRMEMQVPLERHYVPRDKGEAEVTRGD